jgi:hypothetical protein
LPIKNRSGNRMVNNKKTNKKLDELSGIGMALKKRTISL